MRIGVLPAGGPAYWIVEKPVTSPGAHHAVPLDLLAEQINGRPILIIPGLYNSGPQHWQTHWLHTLPGAILVDQIDWLRPTLGDWMASLVDAIRQHPGAILIGHSLGSVLIAHLAQLRGNRNIGGAMLVAPADVDRPGPVGHLLEGFAPVPNLRLPFPSLVVASRTDPYVTIERAKAFATDWGSTFVDLGDAGHINVDSGFGPWPQGLSLLQELIRDVEPAMSA